MLSLLSSLLRRSTLSQITENRKVDPRKLLIFQHTVFRFLPPKGNVGDRAGQACPGTNWMTPHAPLVSHAGSRWRSSCTCALDSPAITSALHVRKNTSGAGK